MSVVVVGCSNSSDQLSSDQQIVVSNMERAIENFPYEISEAQADILEQAKRQGDVTWEHYTQAAQLFVECASEFEIVVTLDKESSRGVESFGYSAEGPRGIELPDGQDSQLVAVRDCQFSSWTLTAILYLDSPSTQLKQQ